MQYVHKKFSVSGLSSEEYRNNFDRTFRKEEPQDLDMTNPKFPAGIQCNQNTMDQPSSDTSPVTPVVPETTQDSSPMDTPTASDVDVTVRPKKVVAVRYEDGTVEWLER